MSGGSKYNSMHDLTSRRGKERGEGGELKENPWHKFCKGYATSHNVSYAAAISLAGPAWAAHKEKNGIVYRARSKPSESGEMEAVEEEVERPRTQQEPRRRKQANPERNRGGNRRKDYGKRDREEYEEGEYEADEDSRHAPVCKSAGVMRAGGSKSPAKKRSKSEAQETNRWGFVPNKGVHGMDEGTSGGGGSTRKKVYVEDRGGNRYRADGCSGHYSDDEDLL